MTTNTEEQLVPAPPFGGRPEVAAEIVASFQLAWGARAIPGRNPCPQPVSLERKHLSQLKEKPYVVADKSDGVRFCLFLTRAGDNKEYSVLVDRKLSLYQVPVAASRKCFEGSLFDGELLWTTGSDGHASQTYLIFDAVSWRGDRKISSEPLPRRLELIRKVFDLGGEEVAGAGAAHSCAKQGKIVCGGNAHGLAFRPKQCFPLDMLPTLLRQMSHLSYITDGLILTPLEDAVHTGTHEGLFKLKWSQTLDFQVRTATRQLLLGAGNGAPEERLDLAFFPELKLQPDRVFWEELRLAMQPSDCPVSSIAEVTLRLEAGEVLLSFHSVRRDKSHPNSIATAKRTIISACEALGVNDLLGLGSMR